jgi:hypothetical protein
VTNKFKVEKKTTQNIKMYRNISSIGQSKENKHVLFLRGEGAA